MEFALEIVFGVSLEMLAHHIAQGRCVHGPCRCRPMQRRNCVRWLNVFPVLCKSAAATAKQEPRYAALLAYERVRHGALRTGFSLEGIPAAVPLRNLVETPRWLKMRFSDVAAHVAKLLLVTEEASAGTFPSFADATDLPANLPPQVHAFFRDLAEFLNELEQAQPRHFQRCKHAACQRLFFSGPRGKATSTPLTPTSDLSGYVRSVQATPLSSLAQTTFCTSACYRSWKSAMAALPCHTDALASEECRKTGRARVGEALRLASKRNEALRRELHAFERAGWRPSALSAAETRRVLTSRMRVMNADFLLLLAGAELAPSGTLRVALPGSFEDWRMHRFFHASASAPMRKVLFRMEKLPPNELLTLTSNHALLRRIREDAGKIFA